MGVKNVVDFEFLGEKTSKLVPDNKNVDFG
jgi:hypothetical protein